MTSLIPLLLTLSGTATAQEEGVKPAETSQELLQALALPVAADRYRQAGASEADTLQALQAMQTARVPAHQAEGAMEEASASAREHGPTDNFGAFVQAQLEQGKRGQDLSAAIRAEHAAHGNGHAKGKQPKGDGEGPKTDHGPKEDHGPRVDHDAQGGGQPTEGKGPGEKGESGAKDHGAPADAGTKGGRDATEGAQGKGKGAEAGGRGEGAEAGRGGPAPGGKGNSEGAGGSTKGGR